jgi:ribosome maturation factor RimP
MKYVETSLRDRLASLVEGMGYEFVGNELKSQGRSSVLRVFIDTPKGVTIDDCTAVSRQVSAMLDVEDPISGQYSLEISSPGLNRPLFEIGHYQNYVGKRIKLRMHNPIDGKRNFVGFLVRVENTDIHLLVDEEEVVLPFSAIEKANVIADIR